MFRLGLNKLSYPHWGCGGFNICPPGAVDENPAERRSCYMDMKELFKFIKYLVATAAILVVVWMVINSGFMLNSIKIETEKFNIEVLGHEKSTKPR